MENNYNYGTTVQAANYDYGVTNGQSAPTNEFVNQPPPPPEPAKKDPNNFNTIIDARDLNTLDEHVCRSVWRDVKLLFLKTWHVIWVFSKNRNTLVYQEWDLWGPVIYTLLLASFSSISVLGDQDSEDADSIFIRILIIVIIGSFVVAINIILLKGKISIFGTVSMLGYCLFPLVLSSCVSLIVVACVESIGVRLLIIGLFGVAFCIWSIMATYGFFKGMLPEGKKFMAVFPVCFYFCILAFNNIQMVDSGNRSKPSPSPPGPAPVDPVTPVI